LRTVTAGVRGLRAELEAGELAEFSAFTLRRLTRVAGEELLLGVCTLSAEGVLVDPAEDLVALPVPPVAVCAFFLRLTFTITLASMLTSSSKLNS